MTTQQRFSLGMPAQTPRSKNQPYPPAWEHVAELRVLRTGERDWERLIGWRAELGRKGWRLLQVNAESGDIVAVFGRTKRELLSKSR
jgi:hypothetical protein